MFCDRPSETVFFVRRRAGFKERLGFAEATADVEPDGTDDEAEQERDSPTPTVKCFRRKAARHERAHQSPREQGQACTSHHPGPVKAATMSRGAFDEKGGGAPPLSPRGETLQQSSEH